MYVSGNDTRFVFVQNLFTGKCDDGKKGKFTVLRKLELVVPHDDNRLILEKYDHKRFKYCSSTSFMFDFALEFVQYKEILYTLPSVVDMHEFSIC